MEVTGVSNLRISPEFKAVDDFYRKNMEEKQEQNIETGKSEGKFPEKYKVPAMLFATALAAATISGAIVHGKMSKEMRVVRNNLQRHIDYLEEPFRRQISNLEDTLSGCRSEVETLRTNNRNLAEVNTRLETERKNATEQLERIFEEDSTPEETRTRLYEQLKEKVKTDKLDYDPMEPPVTHSSEEQALDMSKAVDLPPRVPTTNRSHIRALDIPEIKEDGSFDFNMPVSDEIKVSSMPSRDFKPIKDQMTTVSEGYADSVQWDNNKIARDILQNFFDGHGQTLDGVRIHFEPVGEGRFKVRIEGDSSYTVDKAIFMGESTKREDMKAAGNYGEGLKMASLKLIRDKGAKNVKIGSDNWDLTFKLMGSDLTDRQVMAFDVDKTVKKAGNYIEFETDDRSLLETFRTSINRFYHSGNEHFKCPDFENDKVGIKLLKPRKSIDWRTTQKGEKGAIYIAGQRFEFDGDYDGLEGAIMFLKEKPPKNVLDPSRDRTTLNKGDLESIGSWLYDTMKPEERIDFIAKLEPLWKFKGYDEKMPIDDMFDRFLRWAEFHNQGPKPLLIKFPKDKYVAYSDASNEVCEDLRRKGYIICKEKMHSIGMQNIRDLMGDARAHDPVSPTEIQLQKIKIIKEAIKKLAPAMKRGEGAEAAHFLPEEVDTKIFLFDNTSSRDRRLHGDALAEAITDGAGLFRTSKGFWIDKSYLDRSDFSEVLETALHELSHKAGGDETAEFSYKLTDVNRQAIKALLNNPETRFNLRALNRLWNELTTQSLVVS